MISVPKVGLLSLKMTKLHLFEFVTDVWYEFVILFVLHFSVLPNFPKSLYKKQLVS